MLGVSSSNYKLIQRFLADALVILANSLIILSNHFLKREGKSFQAYC